MALTIDWRFYVVLDVGILGPRDPVAMAQAAIAGGATVLQLRAKAWSARQQVELAAALLPVTQAANVPLIINDQVAIALAVGADGVHLGVDDLPVALARRLMPAGILGYSPEDIPDARRAVADGADYLGVGPFATTHTKLDAGAPIGRAGLQALVDAVTVPVVAVGGLNRTNLAEALSAGAAGIVVASAVLLAADPAVAAREVQQAIAQVHPTPDRRR